jgi:hypothetical protein
LAVQDEATQLFGDLFGDTLLLYRLEHPPSEVNPPRRLVEGLRRPLVAWYVPERG